MRRVLPVIACHLGLLALALGSTPESGHAQRRRLTAEAYIGVANFGRFLEQRLGEELVAIAPERRLTASTALALGLGIGYWPWDNRTNVRFTFTFSPSEFEFEDDTGIGSDRFDLDDVADLNVYAWTLEVMRFLFGREERRVAPYVTAGVTGAIWSTDDDDRRFPAARIGGGSTSVFRVGGVAGVGLHIRLKRHWALRLELNNFALGNPFHGENAFRETAGTWTTFDEPSTVRMSRLTLAGTYTFFRRPSWR
jgi:outer membrane protein W